MASDEYGVSGHGYTVAVEADPVGDPDSYTLVGGLSNDITVKLSRAFEKTMSHNANVGGGVMSNVVEVDDLTFENNYIPGSPVHDGIIRDHHRLNREFKVRLRGPGGTTDNDEVILSGKVQSCEYKGPIGGGPRVFTWVYSVIGPFKIDGVTYN